MAHESCTPKTFPGSFCSPQPASADGCSKTGANDSRDRYQSFGIVWTTHVSGHYLPNLPLLKPESWFKVWHHGQMGPVLGRYLDLRTKPSFWGTHKQGNPSRSHPSQCCPAADQAATPQPAEFSNLSSSLPRQHKLTIKIHFSKPSGAVLLGAPAVPQCCREAAHPPCSSTPRQAEVWCSWRAASLGVKHVLFSSFQKRELCWEQRPGATRYYQANRPTVTKSVPLIRYWPRFCSQLDTP